jgi:hypothetical protein
MSNAEILGPGEPGPQNAKDANFSDNGGNSTGGAGGQAKSFPWERAAFTVLFAFIAWFAFWLSLVLALIAGAIKLFRVQTQDSIGGYARKSADYLSSCLAYVSGATNDKPFPFG